jgi:hypothetical protein
MRNKHFQFSIFNFQLMVFALAVLTGCKSSNPPETEPVPEVEPYLSVSPSQLSIKATGDQKTITVTSNIKWSVSTEAKWLICSPNSGDAGGGKVTINVAANYSDADRTAELTFTAGSASKSCTVNQEFTEMPNYVPTGYSLVWQDEFDQPRTSAGKPALPNSSDWWYETGNGGADGWGNHELQTYVAGYSGQDTCAQIYDGTLKIIAKKVGSQVLSIRMNTAKSWTYGYFEARLKLPTGKGTWPAFWMMPKNFKAWPDDGEIDIMEEVGVDPNIVHCSIHCKAYYHSIGTQKTATKTVPTAQSDFHIYAVEWTEDYIYGFIDGVRYFTFQNDKAGDKKTWPFNAPFYLKLNLAWGGDWGGYAGVDESKLPATYEIDYVRVYQKN